jgi:hypothetical protein
MLVFQTSGLNFLNKIYIKDFKLIKLRAFKAFNKYLLFKSCTGWSIKSVDCKSMNECIYSSVRVIK